MAYDIYREIAGSQRFAALKAKGAHPQRLLWASTGTKNPEYPDLKYVDPLIGPETVNTMPLETLAALRDHGAPALTLMDRVLEERSYLDRLDELGVSLDQATQQLEDEGVQKFSKALDGLLGALQKRVSGSPQQVGERGRGVRGVSGRGVDGGWVVDGRPSSGSGWSS